MEKVLNLVFNGENLRMLVILAFVCSGYALIISKISSVEASLNKRIDGVETSVKDLGVTMNGRIDELKYNDIAHLNGAIEALTYALEKNGSLKKEDKDYVDSRLAR